MNKPAISKNASGQKQGYRITCATPIGKNYCENCGEKRLGSHDLKFMHFIEEFFEGFTHFDNKFFRSVKLLIFKPGLLTEDYCRGKRVNYMKPFPLFIVCNIIFFLLAGQGNVFSIPISGFYNFTPYTDFGTKDAVDKVAPTYDKVVVLSAVFNARMATESKAFLAVFIPVLGSIGLLIGRRRYLSEHMVFSTHYVAFILLWYTFLTLFFTKPFYYFFSPGVHNSTFDLVVTLCSFIVFGVYYGIAAKRFYRITTGIAVIVGVLNVVLFFISLYAYRMLLFFKILNSLN